MTPTHLAATLALCDRVEAHDRTATPGPWSNPPLGYATTGIVSGSDAVVVTKCAQSRGREGVNADLIAAYRALAPALAARLRVVMEVMEEATKMERLHPQHAVCGCAWCRTAVAARAAVAKLEAMP